MLPESSLRQLQMIRKETKGKDIGDLTVDDRLNAPVPNLQRIGNPVDMGIETYKEFTEKDNKLQTIAFKSKTVNKSIKENKNEIMKKDIIKFQDFEKVTEKKEEYTLLGQEKEPKSDPNFGIGAVKDMENKKIAFFNNFVIDPPTPKERPIGGAAGQFIDNDHMQGYINRIEGKDVYIESLEDPLVIKKFNLKDAVKVKKIKESIDFENYNLVLEAIDWNSAKGYFDKLAKNYKFQWITIEQFNVKAQEFGLSQNSNAYQLMQKIKNVGDIIPKGQFGFIMYNPQFSNITLIGNEKGILKQMQNDIIKNYKSFSDTEHLNKGIGQQKTDWAGQTKTTNVGSKGTGAVIKQAGKNSGQQVGLQTYTKPDGEISVATIQLG